MSLAFVVIGAAVGAVVVALFLWPRLARVGAEVVRLAAELREALAGARMEREHHQRALATERDQRAQLTHEHDRQLGEVRRLGEEKVELVKADRDDFVKQMKAVSGEVLGEKAEELRKLAGAQRETESARHSGELGKQKEAIKNLVEPLTKSIEKVEEQIGSLKQDRKRTEGEMKQMFKSFAADIGQLRSGTDSLVSALKRPQVRGSWGEMHLRRCVEMAGMADHVDFHAQASVESDEGRLRPDMTVHLSGGKEAVVDSKVPLEAYLAAREASSPEQEGIELERHAKQARAHIDKLAGKNYQAQFETSPDFVVCFFPNEAVYCAALDRDPTLFEHGASKQVLITTPMTLIALLKSVYYGWRQELIAVEAQAIAEAGRTLHRRVGKFAEEYARLGRQLNTSVSTYNKGAASFDSRLLPAARRMEDLGAESANAVVAPAPIDTSVRELAGPVKRPVLHEATKPTRHEAGVVDELPDRSTSRDIPGSEAA